MGSFSPLRSRRSPRPSAPPPQQLVVFRLRHEWFALPIDSVEKVTEAGAYHGDPNNIGMGLTHYQGRELPVIDLGRQIFPSLPQGTEPPVPPPFLLILKVPPTQERLGIPIDAPPSLRRIAPQALTPVPKTYANATGIQGVRSLILQEPDEPPIFLLNLDALLQGLSVPLLPPGERDTP